MPAVLSTPSKRERSDSEAKEIKTEQWSVWKPGKRSKCREVVAYKKKHQIPPYISLLEQYDSRYRYRKGWLRECHWYDDSEETYLIYVPQALCAS